AERRVRDATKLVKPRRQLTYRRSKECRGRLEDLLVRPDRQRFKGSRTGNRRHAPTGARRPTAWPAATARWPQTSPGRDGRPPPRNRDRTIYPTAPRNSSGSSSPRAAFDLIL